LKIKLFFSPPSYRFQGNYSSISKFAISLLAGLETKKKYQRVESTWVNGSRLRKFPFLYIFPRNLSARSADKFRRLTPYIITIRPFPNLPFSVLAGLETKKKYQRVEST
jgi:hypothetical protein